MKIDWYNSQLTKKSPDVRGQWMYGALKKKRIHGNYLYQVVQSSPQTT